MREITAEERAQWQAACDEATPGPWVTTWDNQTLQLHPADDPSAVLAEWGFAVSPWRPETWEEIDRADIDFIIAARDALPRLLAALTAAEQARDAALGEVTDLRAQVERCRAWMAPFTDWETTDGWGDPPTPPATQPPLLPPDAVQLGLGGRGSYASDLGKG